MSYVEGPCDSSTEAGAQRSYSDVQANVVLGAITLCQSPTMLVVHMRDVPRDGWCVCEKEKRKAQD